MAAATCEVPLCETGEPLLVCITPGGPVTLCDTHQSMLFELREALAMGAIRTMRMGYDLIADVEGWGREGYEGPIPYPADSLQVQHLPDGRLNLLVFDGLDLVETYVLDHVCASGEHGTVLQFTDTDGVRERFAIAGFTTGRKVR